MSSSDYHLQTQLLQIAERGLKLVGITPQVLSDLLNARPESLQCRGSHHSFPFDTSFSVEGDIGGRRGYLIIKERCERCDTDRYRQLDKVTSKFSHSTYEHPPEYRQVLDLVLRGETTALVQFFRVMSTVSRLEAKNDPAIRRIGRAG